jgi:glycosyltransferase involved in cell wall biosynthesis
MISIIVPFYNEEKNVPELYRRIFDTLNSLKKNFEIIFIDDGSTDDTFNEIRKLEKVIGIRLAGNNGQTKALLAGLMKSKGDTIITMDGDLENNPEDIEILLNKFNEGFDIVSGWRVNRWKGQLFARKIPSILANKLISYTTKVKLHDHGSNFRIYKKEVFDGVLLLGDAHRMLVAHLASRGTKVTETPVSYSPRKYGKSKYGISRTFKVILDILAFHFFNKYSSKPMHFFGFIGFASLFFSGLIFLWSLYYRFFEGVHFNRTPLPTLVAIFMVVGFLFILMGLLAEIIVRLMATKDSKFLEPDVKEVIENGK